MQGYEVLNRIEYFEDKVEKLEKKLEIATKALVHISNYGLISESRTATKALKEIGEEYIDSYNTETNVKG